MVEMDKDPVCHMMVDESTAKWKTEYENRTYYFCAPGCRYLFEKEPEKYLNSPAPLIRMDENGGK
jgi:YHS domain-containing protein